jgi:hemolysin activation/secretion protein
MRNPQSSIPSWILCLALSVVLGPILARAQDNAGASSQSRPVPGKPRFNIYEFRVTGNSVLETTAVERSVYPYLGDGKTIDDVEAARGALEQAYHDKGFSTVSVVIPEQQVKDSTVLLHVVEGSVEAVQVLGAKYYSQGRILEKVPEFAEGKVPSFPVAQQQLASVNDGPDRTVTPLLRPGKLPGTVDVDLNVTDQLPLHGSVSLTNDYTPNTTAARLTAGVEYDNLFQRQQRLALLYQMSPQNIDQVKLWSVAYTIPLTGQFLALSFVRSDSATIAGLGGVSVFGRGKIVGLHDILLLPARAPTEGSTFSQNLNIGLDYKAFDQNIQVGSSPADGFATPVSYAPLSAYYNATWTRGANQWDFGTGLEFALRGVGSTPAQFDAKRYQALDNFAIFRMNVDRSQELPGQFSLLAKLDVQLADQPLVSNEQLVVGGVDSVRGYLTASETGDSGARVSIELHSPKLTEGLAPVSEMLGLVFVDGAYARILSPLPDQKSSYELLSAGVGLRAKADKSASLAVDLGWPMRAVPFTRAWSPRLQAGLVFTY